MRLPALALASVVASLVGVALACRAAPAGPPPDERWSEAQRRAILRMSPVPATPDDPTNRVHGDARAIELGRWLFWDTGLSDTGEVSCATCHDPALGWGDGQRLAQAGEVPMDRHTPSLWNAAHQRWFFWDGRADSLWSQALIPLEDPLEHAITRVAVAARVADAPELRGRYEALFGALPELDDGERFPRDARPIPLRPEHASHVRWTAMAPDDRRDVDVVFANVGKAIAAFVATIESRSSPFDAYVGALRDGRPSEALDASALRGLELFLGRGSCATCHHGPLLSDLEFHDVRPPILDPRLSRDPGRFHGVKRLERSPFRGSGAFSDDPGAGAEKLDFLAFTEHLHGTFKTPSLRNVAVTAPYMHHGGFATLEEVVRHYADIAPLPPRGHGGEVILVPFEATDADVRDLVAFLESLTDAAVPEEQLDPWPRDVR